MPRGWHCYVLSVEHGKSHIRQIVAGSSVGQLWMSWWRMARRGDRMELGRARFLELRRGLFGATWVHQ